MTVTQSLRAAIINPLNAEMKALRLWSSQVRGQNTPLNKQWLTTTINKILKAAGIVQKDLTSHSFSFRSRTYNGHN
jgi:hypothetical protein